MQEKPYLVGHQEFAALYGVQPQMVTTWVKRGLLPPETAAVVSGVRYWPLGFAIGFGQSTPRPRQLDLQRVEQLKSEQAPGWLAEDRSELPPLVGQQELRSLFRLPAQGNIATAVASGRFARPGWLLSGSPLWLLETVLEDAPRLQETARGLAWTVDKDVAEALRVGRYEGPGAAVLTRGPRRDK